MKVKLAAVMALAAAILVLAAYLFGMSWGPAPQSNQAGTLQEQVRALTCIIREGRESVTDGACLTASGASRT